MDPSRRRIQQLVLAVLVLATTGGRLACDARTPNVSCNPLPAFTLAPGSCAPLPNPCDDLDGLPGNTWHDGDRFSLCNPPKGVSILTTSSPRTRQLCVATDVDMLSGSNIGYLYQRRVPFSVDGQLYVLGEGTINVTSGAPLKVFVSAMDVVLPPGGATQLFSSVSGGDGNYRYQWQPVPGLVPSDQDPNPFAFPLATTTYALTVTDGTGASASDSVTITVVGDLVVTASPPVVDPGQTSTLNVSGLPGTPVSFFWTPGDTLSDPSIQSPVASPTETMTYQVAVEDASGNVLFGAVTVPVNLLVTDISAAPGTIAPGESAILSVAASGGTPPYSVAWEPTTGLLDPTSASTDAMPGTSQVYTATVTDAAGATASAEVALDVPPAPSVSACFMFPPNPIACEPIQLDASCSSGPPTLRYLWTIEGEASGTITGGPFSFPVFNLGNQGASSWDVTLELFRVEDPANTDQVTATIDFVPVPGGECL